MRADQRAIEGRFALQLQYAGVVGWQAEYVFHPTKKWRFDFAWPDELIAIEINGGTFRKGGGAHTGAGFRRDCVKGLAAAELGWTIITVMPEHVLDGRALQVIERRLAIERGREL